MLNHFCCTSKFGFDDIKTQSDVCHLMDQSLNLSLNSGTSPTQPPALNHSIQGEAVLLNLCGDFVNSSLIPANVTSHCFCLSFENNTALFRNSRAESSLVRAVMA